MNRLTIVFWILALASATWGEPRVDRASGVDSAGTATRRVPLDTLEIVLALKTESNSFGAAKQAADAVFARALANAHALGLAGLRDHYEFAASSQDYLSVGRRGSEVDAALAADQRLWVAEMNAALSEAADAKLRTELIAVASADAAAQARPLAEAAGRTLGPPRSLKARCASSGRPDPELGGVEEIVVTSARFSTRKPFELNRPFESEVERSCGVTARFELAAP